MAEEPATHPNMSAELAQLATLTAMADETAAALPTRGLSAQAQKGMTELRALLSAISAYAAQAYETSREEA